MAKAQSVDQALAQAAPKEVSTDVLDIFEDAKVGMETVRADDFAIPFLSIIQSMSPQRKKEKPEFIPGAEEGMLFNSVTQQLWSGEEGVIVMPCAYARNKIEWKIREEGGGLVGIHPLETMFITQRDDRGRDRVMVDGVMTNRQIVDTSSFYVRVFDPETKRWRPAVINMQNTQKKKAKRWMTMIADTGMVDEGTGKIRQIPMFMGTYRITTVPESNDKGDWYGYVIEQVAVLNIRDDNERELYLENRDFSRSVAAQEVQATYESETDLPF